MEHRYEGVTIYAHSVSPEISLKSEDFKPGRHDGLHMEHETQNVHSWQDITKLLQHCNLTSLEHMHIPPTRNLNWIFKGKHKAYIKLWLTLSSMGQCGCRFSFQPV